MLTNVGGYIVTDKQKDVLAKIEALERKAEHIRWHMDMHWAEYLVSHREGQRRRRA